MSDTGIAGLTLGGGIGWLNGQYGLACDNLVSVDIMTADGQLLTASPHGHPDLFWGVRGGGGNFGIVTAFEYRLHPVGPVLGGTVLYEMRQAREVLRLYREFAQACPDELSTAAELLMAANRTPLVAITVCYCGSLAEGEQVLTPLRTCGLPVADLIRPMPYVAMQRLFDESWPPGRLQYWKSSFVRVLSDDAIDTLVAYAAVMPSPMSAMVLQQMHGAASRVGPTETPFAHRNQQYDFGIYAMWSDPADTEPNVNWARACWEAMQPFMERGVYVNNLGEEGEERVRAAYGPNYERLVMVKNRYDPANIFCLNQNVKPTG